MSQIKHILFDNDGTIVDSEVIAQQTMIRLMAEHDFVMSEQEYSHQFPGLLGRDILRILRDNHGFDAPANFMQRMCIYVRMRFGVAYMFGRKYMTV
ncbi:MAG: HAD hydrolase-like protein, partial [Bacteroidota bacterium]